MTCTDEGFDGPVRPRVVVGQISVQSLIENATLSGLIHTYWGEGIGEATVEITGPSHLSTTMTTELGEYVSKELPMDVEYNIKPSKEDSPLNGLSTYGLFVAQKYLLGYAPKEITSPYQIIAMDANCDNRFTTFDLFVLQQLVIGNIEEFPNCPSWICLLYTSPSPRDRG